MDKGNNNGLGCKRKIDMNQTKLDDFLGEFSFDMERFNRRRKKQYEWLTLDNFLEGDEDG